ncbi:unnamed protein product [Mytilus coruscus]|uniref:Myb/SANT-like DNA-binding domain-containing protein n=1 Tax=Mytilus coruscus TaxID=42192 RepID=A0A6J8C714_MYTCO|nr:unnamed protein product [Mytilus coruscus]
MSNKGDKEIKKVQEDPKLGGRSDYNNTTLQTGTLQPRLGRGTTMEGIGGTYELVSGVGFVLVEEASTSSTLQVQGTQATLPPVEQATLLPVEEVIEEEVGDKDSAPVANEDPAGYYEYRCPRCGRMETTYILRQRDQHCPVRGLVVEQPCAAAAMVTTEEAALVEGEEPEERGKNKIWTNITNKINALGVANRTQKEVRDKWRNLTTKAKSAFTEHRREINKTGGGQAPKKPSSSVERVVNTLQDSTSFSGIQGGIETSCFECFPAANEESDDDEIENTIDVQPKVIAVAPTRITLSPMILVNSLPLNTTVGLPSRPVTAMSESTENISVPSINVIKKRRRVTQNDVFQMQIKVLKEQMSLYSWSKNRQKKREKTDRNSLPYKSNCRKS